MKPIIGFVVHPKMVIASPIPGIATANPKQNVDMIRVTIKFCLVDMPVSGYTNSSYVSFEGNTHIGAAAKIANNSNITANFIAQFGYSISSTFCLSIRVFKNSGFPTSPR